MKSVTGSFVRPDGTPAAGATVNFLLSAPANCSIGLLVHERVTVILDQNGALPEDFELWCCDELYTAGTYYNVTLVDPVYGRVLYENVIIAGTSPIALNQLTPTFTE